MALNSPQSYGKDIRCISDADGLFSSATGIDIPLQAAIHRITTDSVLGPGGDDWGYDSHKLLGMKQDELTRQQPLLSEVITRDQRILTADVELIATSTDGMADVVISVKCTTAAGPFEFVRSVLSLSSDDIERQAAQ